jgi:hypothetical protein
MQNLILLEGTEINAVTIVIAGMITTWPFDKPIARRVGSSSEKKILQL